MMLSRSVYQTLLALRTELLVRYNMLDKALRQFETIKPVPIHNIHNLSEPCRTQGLATLTGIRLFVQARRTLSENSLRITNSQVCGSPCSNMIWRCKHTGPDPYPPLVEADLEESFVRGSGPGGQKTNKTNNAVCLKHIPTGLVVKCHESRSQSTNRARARRHMQERLDWHYNGENCYISTQKRLLVLKKRDKKRATQKKLAKLKEFKNQNEEVD